MPLLKITSNKHDPTVDQQLLIKKLSEAIAEMLGKLESYVLVTLEHNEHMMFGGTNDPLAYLELKCISLPTSSTTDFSAQLCELVADNLGIPKDRIYIEFSDVARIMWGWNGRTFA